MRLPRQKYQNGLPFPSAGDLPNPGIEPMSTALAGEGKPKNNYTQAKINFKKIGR